MTTETFPNGVVLGETLASRGIRVPDYARHAREVLAQPFAEGDRVTVGGGTTVWTVYLADETTVLVRRDYLRKDGVLGTRRAAEHKGFHHDDLVRLHLVAAAAGVPA